MAVRATGGTARLVAWAASAWLLALVAVACGDEDATSSDRASLSAECRIDSDCDSPLVCAFQRCHTACNESRDCPAGELCIAADPPYNVCQTPDEATCNYNSECPEGQRCAGDRRCRRKCGADSDCLTNQKCVTGACADTTELVDGSLPTPAGGTLPNAGQSCTRPSDCGLPLTCRNHACTTQCAENRDCTYDRVCTAGSCTFPDQTTPASKCVHTSECPAPLACLFQICAFECVGDRDCTRGRVCTSHVCTYPSDAGDAGGMDASSDASMDASDGRSDAAVDSGMDSGTDAGGATDGSFDSGTDGSFDSGSDARDSAVDASFPDTGVDASPDAQSPIDAGNNDAIAPFDGAVTPLDAAAFP